MKTNKQSIIKNINKKENQLTASNISMDSNLGKRKQPDSQRISRQECENEYPKPQNPPVSQSVERLEFQREEQKILLQSSSLGVNNLQPLTQNETQQSNNLSKIDQWFSEVDLQAQEQTKEGEEQEPYFNSYSQFAIHEKMIKDKPRTGAYYNAIRKNEQYFKNKIVLDVGAGSGILSIFAVKSGAQHVYAVEKSDFFYTAQEIIRDNNMESKITLIKAKIEDEGLQIPKVDIIISEWMGFFLLYEGMTDSIIFARDTYLKPDGLMFPSRARIFIAAMEDETWKNKKFDFFDNNDYGINFRAIKHNMEQQVFVDTIPINQIISPPCKILEINMKTVKKEDLDFLANYKLTINYNQYRSTYITGIASWFEVDFPNCSIQLSTSPFKDSTHWAQQFFYVTGNQVDSSKLKVNNNDTIYGKFGLRKHPQDKRGLQIKMSFNINGFKTDSFYSIT